ncbi:MAG: protein kinase [Bacteroidales bacterium]|nr:protein kinase [Bacteroidales bacterium]
MSEIVSDTMREVTPSLDDGRYSVVATLREGRLYLAERAGKRFVLKTAAGARGLELLKREYELSTGLSHPSLAYVFTYDEVTPLGPSIVQEYVDGRSLGVWLTEKPSAKERRRVFGELLSVMAYLHKKGIVHNDLSPENILITRTGDALKLIDLGFADSDTWAQKALGGTRGYASPELIAGESVDARSDIYSIGALMRDIFPGRYGHISRRCMRKEPKRRYQSVGVLERAWNRRRLPLQIAVGAVVAGLLAWPLFRGPQVEIVEVESQALQATVDSLQDVISERDREAAEQEAALSEAKAQVDAVFDRALPAFRKALRAAKTTQEVTDAWLAFTNKLRKVNYDIPDATPEAVRPQLRDYVIQRNNAVLPKLSEEMTARINELAATD